MAAWRHLVRTRVKNAHELMIIRLGREQRKTEAPPLGGSCDGDRLLRLLLLSCQAATGAGAGRLAAGGWRLGGREG